MLLFIYIIERFTLFLDIMYLLNIDKGAGARALGCSAAQLVAGSAGRGFGWSKARFLRTLFSYFIVRMLGYMSLMVRFSLVTEGGGPLNVMVLRGRSYGSIVRIRVWLEAISFSMGIV